MINVTPQFRQALYDGNRNYLETVKITLTDGTVLNLTNEDIWQGSMSFEDAVSSDSDFQIGAAIINKQKLQLNNMYEDFSDYVFEGAEVITNIGLACGTNGAVERIRKGTFIVDTADYDEAIVTLNLLDYMSKFEKPFSEINITFPAQAQAIVNAICNHCGVTLGTVNFPHRTFEIAVGPEKETCSCREVIAWVAQICGCFARCDTYGRLELKWYDTNALDSFLSGLDGGVFDETTSSRYQTGDTADGGSFNPWNTGYVYDDGDFTQVLKNVHVISETFSHKISVDDVVITGVRILVKANSDSESGNEIVSYMEGTAGYVVEISNNELITESNVDEILGWLGVQLIGLTFRKANVSIPSDPSIEAGDVGIIFDRKGNNFPILISKTIFSPFGQQTVVSSAQTPARNSAARYSAETKNYVELRKQVKEQMTTWELAEKALREAIANANGLYTTDVTDPSTGATIHCLHNKGPDGTATDQSGLNASDIRIMISDVGITMTANGTDPSPTWYGMTVDGRMVASIMSTIGLNFDWGTGGTLTLGGQDNVNGLLRMLDANGNEVGRWSNSGIDILKGSIEIPYSWTSTWGATYTSRTQMINRGVALIETSNQNDIIVAKLGGLIQDTLYPYHDYPNNLLEIYSKIVRYSNRITECSFDIRSGRLTVYFNDDESSGEFYASGGYIFAKGTNSFEDSSISNCSFTYRGNVLQVIRTDSLNQLKTRFRVYLGEDSSYSEVLMDAQLLCTENATFRKNVTVDGNLSVTGTKNRLVKTTDYSERYLYCYETTTPVFGDIGEGVIGEDGKIYIQLDPIFLETITAENYQVFIQLYDDGKAYVSERHKSYFVVTGTPNIAFGWEVKAKQSNYENYRLEDKRDIVDITGKDYCDLAVTHIKDIMKERGITNESSNISNNLE